MLPSIRQRTFSHRGELTSFGNGAQFISTFLATRQNFVFKTQMSVGAIETIRFVRWQTLVIWFLHLKILWVVVIELSLANRTLLIADFIGENMPSNWGVTPCTHGKVDEGL